MFEIIYLFVIVLAALPLAGTLMLGAGGKHIAFMHRLYRDAAYILAAVLGIIVFEVALRISLENYWFQELGQSRRYWLSLEYRVAIFFVVSLLIGLFVGVNLRVLSRPYVVPTSAPWVVGFVVAALVGFLATPLWIPLMRFLGATPAGAVDPVFGRDLSFYLLALPLYDDIVEIVIGILWATIALWAVMGIVAHSATAAFAYRPEPFGDLTRIEASPSYHPIRLGRSERAGSGRAWFSALSCASHWGLAGSWPAIIWLWTDIRRSWPARLMQMSIFGYPDTTSWSHAGSRRRRSWGWQLPFRAFAIGC